MLATNTLTVTLPTSSPAGCEAARRGMIAPLEIFTRVRRRGILRTWASQSRRHQRSWAPVAPQNSEFCACYIWTRRDRPPCALEVSGEKSRLAPLRYPCPLDRRKPILAPALSVQHLVRYSP